MIVVFEQVFTLFLFAAAGYALSKSGVVNPGHSKLLSTLLVYVFLPCNIFRTFSENCTALYLRENYRTILASIGLLAVLAVSMEFVSRLFSRDSYERRIYRYSLIIANYGYMGYALAESLLGAAKLMNVMMFAMPLSVYTYTVGFSSLTKRKMTLRKLINPVNLSMILGIAAGLSGLPMPNVLMGAVGKASSCMAPVSMLMAGIVISEFRLRDLLRQPRTYILTALRLVVIPILLGSALSLLGRPEIVESAVVLLAMPCGLNTIVFPKMVGENCEIGAGLAFISNILACATIPLVFALFGIG